MKRLIINFTIVVFTMSAIGSADAAIMPADLNPGDPYYLAFVTQGTRDAVSGNIADYNQFVNDQAGLNPVDTGTDIGVQWFVMGSTATPLVDAIDNANLVPGVPIDGRDDQGRGKCQSIVRML